jgi:hypothetical protein
MSSLTGANADHEISLSTLQLAGTLYYDHGWASLLHQGAISSLP